MHYAIILPLEAETPMTFFAFVEKNWMLFATLVAAGLVGVGVALSGGPLPH